MAVGSGSGAGSGVGGGDTSGGTSGGDDTSCGGVGIRLGVFSGVAQPLRVGNVIRATIKVRALIILITGFSPFISASLSLWST